MALKLYLWAVGSPIGVPLQHFIAEALKSDLGSVSFRIYLVVATTLSVLNLSLNCEIEQKIKNKSKFKLAEVGQI